MVFKGHYLQYINQWKCGHPDVSLLGFREIDSGELFGIFGFEIFDGAAQITLAKHRGGDYCFATFMWCTGLEVILDLGVDLCYCGSTADSLKRRLGLREWESFKLRGWEGKPWNKMLG